MSFLSKLHAKLLLLFQIVKQNEQKSCKIEEKGTNIRSSENYAGNVGRQ